MSATRRQFALVLAAAGLAPAAAFAQDDDGPPNVFFSPHGQPFRRPAGAPYPVVDWFRQADKNADGKLDHAEFMADAEAFFKILDLNGDGRLDGFEVQVYEHRVAPEVLGYRVPVSAALSPAQRPKWGDARLWRAQMVIGGPHQPNQPTQPKGLDDSSEGAAPYNFFSSPEPISAADSDFRGVIIHANYMRLAERHFSLLDEHGAGYLTLDKLPKTKVQLEIEKLRRHFG